MTTPVYNASQKDLYNACRIGWGLCRTHLPVFSAFKMKYSQEYINIQLKAVDDAELLPDLETRMAKAKSLRMDLVVVKNAILYQHGLLKSYIDDAFDVSKRELMYTSCGDGYTTKAKAESWSDMTSLLSSALPFLEENLATLTADNNMPPAFANEFKKLAQDFKTTYTDWFTTDNGTYDKTDEKVIANNTIYNTLLAMLTDGSRLFKKDQNLAKQFTFSALLAQTHGTKAAGIKGKITRNDTGAAVANALVSVNDSDKIVTTDAEGRFEISPLSIGNYALLVKADGFGELRIADVTVRTGITTRQNISLLAA
jgi:uncharacterized membrane protein